MIVPLLAWDEGRSLLPASVARWRHQTPAHAAAKRSRPISPIASPCDMVVTYGPFRFSACVAGQTHDETGCTYQSLLLESAHHPRFRSTARQRPPPHGRLEPSPYARPNPEQHPQGRGDFFLTASHASVSWSFDPSSAVGILAGSRFLKLHVFPRLWRVPQSIMVRWFINRTSKSSFPVVLSVVSLVAPIQPANDASGNVKRPFASHEPEFGLYLAIKFRAAQEMSQHLRLEDAAVVSTRLPPGLLFSARRVHQLLQPPRRGSGISGREFTDFYDVSSHFIRDRLKNLNHGTFLRRRGSGLRDAATYQLSSPLAASEFYSYLQLRELLGNRIELGLDTYRTAEAFSNSSFSFQEFVHLHQAHRERLIGRRWYRIRSATAASSPQFTRFVANRLQQLVAADFVVKDKNQYRIAAKGQEVAHWLELFAYSAPFAVPGSGKS